MERGHGGGLPGRISRASPAGRGKPLQQKGVDCSPACVLHPYRDTNVTSRIRAVAGSKHSRRIDQSGDQEQRTGLKRKPVRTPRGAHWRVGPGVVGAGGARAASASDGRASSREGVDCVSAERNPSRRSADREGSNTDSGAERRGGPGSLLARRSSSVSSRKAPFRPSPVPGFPTQKRIRGCGSPAVQLRKVSVAWRL
jgi:hypothetical protein